MLIEEPLIVLSSLDTAINVFETPPSEQLAVEVPTEAVTALPAITVPVSAFPSSSFHFNREVMRCANSDHDMSRIKFLCVDAHCKSSIKLACAECILSDHIDHKYVPLERFLGEVSQKFTRLHNYVTVFEQDIEMTDFQAATEC